jgi:hypothetical protein
MRSRYGTPYFRNVKEAIIGRQSTATTYDPNFDRKPVQYGVHAGGRSGGLKARLRPLGRLGRACNGLAIQLVLASTVVRRAHS